MFLSLRWGSDPGCILKKRRVEKTDRAPDGSNTTLTASAWRRARRPTSCGSPWWIVRRTLRRWAGRCRCPFVCIGSAQNRFFFGHHSVYTRMHLVNHVDFTLGSRDSRVWSLQVWYLALSLYLSCSPLLIQLGPVSGKLFVCLHPSLT